MKNFFSYATGFLVTYLLIGSILGSAHGNSSLQEDCQEKWEESDASEVCSSTSISGLYSGQWKLPKCSIKTTCPGMFGRDARVDVIVDLDDVDKLVNCYGTLKRNSCG